MTNLAQYDGPLIPSAPALMPASQADFLALRYTQGSYGLRYGRTDYAPERNSDDGWIAWAFLPKSHAFRLGSPMFLIT